MKFEVFGSSVVSAVMWGFGIVFCVGLNEAFKTICFKWGLDFNNVITEIKTFFSFHRFICLNYVTYNFKTFFSFSDYIIKKKRKF